MNTIITSKKAIIEASKEIAYKRGLQAINIRGVAASCGVSVGSVYYYFPSKAELVSNTIKAVWQEIFTQASSDCIYTSFIQYVAWLFNTIQKGTAAYPSFFALHSLSFAVGDKQRGREVMADYFEKIEQGLKQALENDKGVAEDIFTQAFKETDLVKFVFSNILSLSMRQAKTCDTLIEVISRIIY